LTLSRKSSREFDVGRLQIAMNDRALVRAATSSAIWLAIASAGARRSGSRVKASGRTLIDYGHAFDRNASIASALAFQPAQNL
jgi:hypothetical protein